MRRAAPRQEPGARGRRGSDARCGGVKGTSGRRRNLCRGADVGKWLGDALKGCKPVAVTPHIVRVDPERIIAFVAAEMPLAYRSQVTAVTKLPPAMNTRCPDVPTSETNVPRPRAAKTPRSAPVAASTRRRLPLFSHRLVPQRARPRAEDPCAFDHWTVPLTDSWRRHFPQHRHRKGCRSRR